jgi:hypothetical protein
MGDCIEQTRQTKNKLWEEMTDPERVLVLRKELVRTQEQLAKVSTFVTKLMEHDHQGNRIVTRLANLNEESYGGFCFRVKDFEKEKFRV